MSVERVCYSNVNGYRSRAADIGQFLCTSDVNVLCVSESRLNSNCPPPYFNKYFTVRKDRNDDPYNSGGGLLIFIRKNISYEVLSLPFAPNNLEHIFVAFYFGNVRLFVLFLYNPPDNVLGCSNLKVCLRHVRFSRFCFTVVISILNMRVGVAIGRISLEGI